jgi:hypothetical protein
MYTRQYIPVTVLGSTPKQATLILIETHVLNTPLHSSQPLLIYLFFVNIYKPFSNQETKSSVEVQKKPFPFPVWGSRGR